MENFLSDLAASPGHLYFDLFDHGLSVVDRTLLFEQGLVVLRARVPQGETQESIGVDSLVLGSSRTVYPR